MDTQIFDASTRYCDYQAINYNDRLPFLAYDKNHARKNYDEDQVLLRQSLINGILHINGSVRYSNCNGLHCTLHCTLP